MLSPAAVGAGEDATGQVDGPRHRPAECAAPSQEERGESVPQRHPPPHLGVPGAASPCPDPLAPWQTLQKELQGHAPRLAEVLARGEAAAEGPCPELAERAQELRVQWEALREEVAARQRRLQEAGEAQQYYMDAGEAEAWVSEQELFMGDEEKPKVREAPHRVPVSLGASVLCPAVPSRAITCHPMPSKSSLAVPRSAIQSIPCCGTQHYAFTMPPLGAPRHPVPCRSPPSYLTPLRTAPCYCTPRRADPTAAPCCNGGRQDALAGWARGLDPNPSSALMFGGAVPAAG